MTITLPNYLTLGRLLSVPIFLYGFFAANWSYQATATIIFALGAISDLWDGKIARSRGQVTPFGDFMDPLADKLLTLAGFWAILIREDFGAFEAITLGAVLLITLREIALTVARIWRLQSGSSLITSIWGKWKTGIQLVALLFGLTALNVRDFLIEKNIAIPAELIDNLFPTIVILFILAAVTSLISGWLYFFGGGKRRG